ncbi:Uma2 family endonuclease [Crossiella sp. SN42]|uniref:Uma2 family endonuclease n=1 Tax=Crossiella sp. SN42 TaxID=2944808 RepID=UPI00207C658A|nr:Uma2 family endonuclease [Crossiella sp. SN42]MCO1581700.1 Uma2 family endonuclease [Crossiella sp. SN42]
MTALPETGFFHLLTIEEYLALGEVEHGYTELLEGRLLMSPSPVPDHNVASAELRDQLKPQLPADLEVIQDIDIDLEFAPPGGPGSSRRPDLIVVDRNARRRVRAEGGMIRASEVLVVVEVVSPGSRRTDNVAKRTEYAEAGIPHYWILDIVEPMSLVACHLTEEFGYQDDSRVTGTFTTTVPFPVTIDLGRLN